MSVAGVPDAASQPLRAFVEVALVNYDERAPAGKLPATVGAPTWADDPRVALEWSSHILATNGVPATLAIDSSAAGASGCSGQRRLTVTPNLAASSSQVRLDVAVDFTALPRAGGFQQAIASCPNQHAARTTIVIDNQQAVFLATDRGPKSVLVITPYLVRDDAELEQIMRCKKLDR